MFDSFFNREIMETFFIKLVRILSMMTFLNIPKMTFLKCEVPNEIPVVMCVLFNFFEHGHFQRTYSFVIIKTYSWWHLKLKYFFTFCKKILNLIVLCINAGWLEHNNIQLVFDINRIKITVYEMWEQLMHC